jgi:hypothetical protein
MKTGQARKCAAWMLAHGTAFERHLAEAWYSAGWDNRFALVAAFPNLFQREVPSIGDI